MAHPAAFWRPTHAASAPNSGGWLRPARSSVRLQERGTAAARPCGVRGGICCSDPKRIGSRRVLRQKDGVATYLIGDGLDVAVVQVIDVVVDVDDVRSEEHTSEL